MKRADKIHNHTLKDILENVSYNAIVIISLIKSIIYTLSIL